MAAELSAPTRRDPDPPAPMKGALRRGRIGLFERTTMCSQLLVLLVLLGIIAALTWAAIPAFARFGFGFLVHECAGTR
jgi:ABC-type phosphate transport system permease subunit